MADGFEQAALAFDRDMGNASARPSGGGMSERQSAPEPIFGHSDSHETDILAGGDDKPTPEEIEARRSKRQPVEEEEFDPMSLLDEENDDEGQDPDEGEQEGDGEDDEDGDEDAELFDQKVAVMVDGEEQEVSVREALNGYIRTQTWHKRMNELDDVKKELGSHAARVVEDRQRADALLSEAEQVMQEFLPPEPDWDKLFAEDPANARRLQKNYESLKGKVTEIREKRLKAQKEQAERDLEETVAYSKQEFQKFAAITKWRNKEEMEKDINSMRKTALSAGFSEGEIRNVHDSRMLNLLRKASKFDRMMAARPKPSKTTKTPVTPGAGSKRTAHKGIIGAQKKLAKTGSIEDAAAVFGQIINRR